MKHHLLPLSEKEVILIAGRDTIRNLFNHVLLKYDLNE